MPNRHYKGATKIVATLGPSSSSPEIICALAQAGADVFRLNFSHGSHEDHAARHAAIREVEAALRRPIGILADLQGPKLRVATFAKGPVILTPGQQFRLDLDLAPGNQERVGMPHPEILSVLTPGQDLLLDDGKIRLRVIEADPAYVTTEIVTGGPLSDRKGVSVPQAVLPLAALTDKDRRDLAFALDLGVDWVALSFVQRADDVAEAKKLIQGRAGVLAKLEKPAAIAALAPILELADAVMVARGDLGVELPAEDVPAIQRHIVRASRRAGKPVIIATQMLESMIQSPTPTRAEASDVATAVYDGVDAVMLSAETASGAYPREAVAMMARIIRRTEQDELHRPLMMAEVTTHEHTASDAIASAAAQVAETTGAAVIAIYTTSGLTALRVSRERPCVPILGLTAAPETARRLTLSWGMSMVLTRDCRNFEDMVEIACQTALSHELAKARDLVVITAGVPFGTPGATNILRVAHIAD